jgi:hypothetical protein
MLCNPSLLQLLSGSRNRIGFAARRRPSPEIRRFTRTPKTGPDKR